ncbi:MFS transporter [Actinoplanes sp. NPDC051851]|uniref:MFS transporter n=1 Tax=Actinoplanes sp. NPDC051851 TaxID=3154753 RepID=UPI00341C520D
MATRGRWFLGASFLSAFGDVLVVTAVPFGVGSETGRIEFTVVFWLVPALAVLAASFAGRHLARRVDRARFDYMMLLLGIAAVEVVISLLTLGLRSDRATLILSVVFVALYAFAKEGIPRLLYQVAVYRYFADGEEYSRLVGVKSGLDIAAALLATVVAAAAVATDTWRFAFLLDAATFVVLAAALRFAGRDPAPEEPAPTTGAAGPAGPARVDASLRTGLIAVLVAIPLFHGVNAAFVNYLPLLNKEFGVMAANTSILLLAVLRLPGMLLGLAYDRVRRWASPLTWATVLPIVFVTVAATYLVQPNAWSVYGLLLLGGLNIGVFAPSDAVIRNQIPGAYLIGFNVIVLRWLGVFQAVACLGAILVFTYGGMNTAWLGVIVAAAVVGGLLLPRVHARNPLLSSRADRDTRVAA